MKRTLLLTAALTATLSAAAPVHKMVLAYAPKDTLSFNLIGAFDRGHGWRGAEQVGAEVGTRMYTIYALGSNLGQIEGSQPRPRGEDGLVGRLPRKLYRDSILINGDLPDLCKTTSAPSDDEVAPSAVRAFLQGKGVEVKSLKLFQNLSVDLDEDGQAERVVVAGQREPYSDEKQPNEFSVVGVIRDGVFAPLEFQSATEQASLPWEDYEVMLIAHLDGKGPAEIVVHYSYYEGGGVMVMGQDAAGAWKVVARGDWGV